MSETLSWIVVGFLIYCIGLTVGWMKGYYDGVKRMSNGRKR